MAIYTTELITDRDYNIPEGRLPLEYALDQANKAKTHSENAEVHVTAADRESWNGKLDQDAMMEERDAVVELYDAEAEKGFCAGNYAVISGSMVPGGELLRAASAAIPAVNMPDGSAAGTRLLVLEQRESAGAAWREAGRSAVQVGEEEFGAVTNPVPVWEFTGCELIAGQDLRIRSENEAGVVVPLFIYMYSVDDDGCYVYNNSTSAEQPGWLAAVRFYLTQNVSKYATVGELASHTADADVHVTADEKAAWNAVSPLAPHAAFLAAAATGDKSTCKYALLQFYDVNAVTGTHPCSISGYHSAEKLQELNYAAHSYGGWIEQISDSMMLLYCGKNDSFTSNDFGTFVLFPLVNTTDMTIPHSICYLNLPMQFHLDV